MDSTIKMATKDKPLISIVTVVFNGEKHLEQTIQSVVNQTYKNIEYIIIDGGSTDGTVDIIKKYEDKISYWVSEKDSGIYDAMNKGIDVANGEWINFMNAGDIFFDNNVLESVFHKESLATDNIDLFYSDSITDKNIRYICNKDKRILIHQALIYRLSLHDEIGKYIVVKNITTADYLFFMLAYNYRWHKLNFPISIHDTKGISSGLHTFLQKNAIDLLFGFNGRIKAILYLATHPAYNFIKRKLFR
ncbi:MAG: glycosyltransferase [Campylobacterota bacterium]|nr:glycosyltransferase [Campylobacterota bacterium]